jgi:hypothetical protein
MKMHHLIWLTILGILVVIGLLSMPFLPSIEAMLVLPSRYQTMIVTHTHTTMPTKMTVAGTPSHIAPARTPATTTILASDTFQRADRPFWGKASDGQIWGGDANSKAGFVIADHSGQIIEGHGIYNATLGGLTSDAEVVFSGSLSDFDHSNLGAVLRWRDEHNWYKAYVNGTQLILLKDVAGTMIMLNAVPFTASAGTSYTLRFCVIGSQLLARVWPTGQIEPAIWMVAGTDENISSGFGGLRLLLQDGVDATITMFTESAVTTPSA